MGLREAMIQDDLETKLEKNPDLASAALAKIAPKLGISFSQKAVHVRRPRIPPLADPKPEGMSGQPRLPDPTYASTEPEGNGQKISKLKRIMLIDNFLEALDAL